VGAASINRDTRPVSPYGTLITHGMVLDEAGKKMSKSLGNIVSPMTIIHGGKVGHHILGLCGLLKRALIG